MKCNIYLLIFFIILIECELIPHLLQFLFLLAFLVPFLIFLGFLYLSHPPPLPSVVNSSTTNCRRRACLRRRGAASSFLCLGLRATADWRRDGGKSSPLLFCFEIASTMLPASAAVKCSPSLFKPSSPLSRSSLVLVLSMHPTVLPLRNAQCAMHNAPTYHHAWAPYRDSRSHPRSLSLMALRRSPITRSTSQPRVCKSYCARHRICLAIILWAIHLVAILPDNFVKDDNWVKFSWIYCIY